MPCIRNDNGRAVPGAKGSCPIGSAWSDTADNNKFDWQDVETVAKRRYFGDDGEFRGGTAAMDAATGLMFIPGVGWIARGAMAGGKGIGSLIGKLFTRKVAGNPASLKSGVKFTPANNLNANRLPKPTTTQVPKYPINAPNAGRTIVTPNRKVLAPSATGNLSNLMNKATPAGRAFSPLRSAAAVGIGSQAVDYAFPFTERGIEAKKVRDANAAAVASKKAEDEQVVQDAAALEAAKVQAEKDRVANLGFWEKMKEPGYWDERDGTGLTRLDRLGQLMTYYGQTPKQRANSTSPADRWAEMTTANASTAASLQKSMLADSPFSNIGDKTGMASIKKLVQEEYGDKWYTFGEDEEGVDQITAAIYTRMVNLAKLYPGKSILEYYEEAKADYDASEEA